MNKSPKLFRRGPPAEVWLFVLVLISVALLITDAKVQILEPVRQVVSTGLYPFQRLMLLPRDGVQLINEWFNAANLVRSENEALQRQRIELAQVSSHAAQLSAENVQLRRLLGVSNTINQPAIVVEILYEPSSLFNQHLVFNKGSQAGIAPGMPVINEGGVVGQIVRVTAMTSEAALVTDAQIAVPVQISRNGLRLIAFGVHPLNKMEVRYLAADSDIKENDLLVTSGIGGFFPAGLPVARVESIHRNTSSGFAYAQVEPTAHPEHYRHFLVLQVNVDQFDSNNREVENSEEE